jgi:hypothetical protein
MVPNRRDFFLYRLPPTHLIAKLPATTLYNVLGTEYQKLLKSGLRFEKTQSKALDATLKRLPYRPVGSEGEKRLHFFDSDCTKLAELLESACRNGEWKATWELSDRLLDELEFRKALPHLEGLEELKTMETMVAIVRAWLLYVFNLAEEKIRPMDLQGPWCEE